MSVTTPKIHLNMPTKSLRCKIKNHCFCCFELYGLPIGFVEHECCWGSVHKKRTTCPLLPHERAHISYNFLCCALCSWENHIYCCFGIPCHWYYTRSLEYAPLMQELPWYQQVMTTHPGKDYGHRSLWSCCWTFQREQYILYGSKRCRQEQMKYIERVSGLPLVISDIIRSYAR